MKRFLFYLLMAASTFLVGVTSFHLFLSQDSKSQVFPREHSVAFELGEKNRGQLCQARLLWLG